MSPIEDLLRAALLADPNVSGMVGTRIYPIDDVPQGTREPYIAYQSIDVTPTVRSMDDGAVELEAARITFNVLAPSYDRMRALLIAAWNLFRGGFASADGIQFATPATRSVFPKDQGTKLYAGKFDLIVTYSAAEAA